MNRASIEDHPELRDAYCYAKVKQEEFVEAVREDCGGHYVVVRPGAFTVLAEMALMVELV